jgi:hypothetical protein
LLFTKLKTNRGATPFLNPMDLLKKMEYDVLHEETIKEFQIYDKDTLLREITYLKMQLNNK